MYTRKCIKVVVVPSWRFADDKRKLFLHFLRDTYMFAGFFFKGLFNEDSKHVGT